MAPFELSSPKYLTVSAIRQAGTLSRIRIAESIGYSPSKITSVVNDLIADGILEETGEVQITGARRAKEIGCNPRFGYIVVAKIGMTTLDVALVDFSERIRVRRMLSITPQAAPGTVLNQICRFVLERIDKLDIPLSDVLAFGITVPSPVEKQSGTLFDSPLMPSWGGYQIASLIRETFPYAMVIVENEANAMAFGELRKGSSQDLQSLVCINVGVSIHVGFILGGQIFHGANGRAGDIGHIHVQCDVSDDAGSETVLLESIASEIAITHQALQAVTAGKDTMLSHYDPDLLTAHDVAVAATEGDLVAQGIIHRSAHAIGEVLANIVNILDPDLILIGGDVSEANPTFLAAIRRSILDRSPSLTTQHLRIEVAPLGHEATILGMTTLVLENLFVIGT
ncbi:MAG: ROK family transcriptional regulator [Anaerolineae bacterium]|nr:ROK family transcriptional regulator [Anaerolineae bacterium]